MYCGSVQDTGPCSSSSWSGGARAYYYYYYFFIIIIVVIVSIVIMIIISSSSSSSTSSSSSSSRSSSSSSSISNPHLGLMNAPPLIFSPQNDCCHSSFTIEKARNILNYGQDFIYTFLRHGRYQLGHLGGHPFFVKARPQKK